MRLVRLGLAVLGTYLALGCNKETPPAAEEPRSASNAATSPPAAGPATPDAAAASAPSEAAPTAAAKISDPAFELSVDPPAAALKAGQAGSVDVVLVAKAPFHVNDKYPIKLKLKETPGIKYANMTIGKDAASTLR